MVTAAWLPLFVAGVAVSLAASWRLVSRLERLEERAGFSEACWGWSRRSPPMPRKSQ
jgi:hypothetical protein